MIDLQLLQVEKGGNPEVVRESQRKRFASIELVDEVLSLYKNWVTLEFQLNQMQQEVNAIQKVITTKKKAKEDADAELAQKKEQDAKIADFKPKVAEAEREMRATLGSGQRVHLVDDHRLDPARHRAAHPERQEPTVLPCRLAALDAGGGVEEHQARPVEHLVDPADVRIGMPVTVTFLDFPADG